MTASRTLGRGHPITAYSAVSSLGTTTTEVLAGLRAGRCALFPAPEGTPFETVCGSVPDPLQPLPAALRAFDSRNNRLAARALSELEAALGAARDRWGPERLGIAVGSSTAAMDETERAYCWYLRTGKVPPGFDAQRHASPEGLLHALRSLTGIRGPAAVVSTACSSSGKAFGMAKRWLDAGVVDAVLVGGVDTLCQTTLRGFRALSLLSDEPARPFSSARRGINIGEAAAFAILERRGEGPRLLGVGESADAHHMSAPDPDGRGAYLAMEAALEDAGVGAAEVDHVNAHGTGTRLNDVAEARALRSILGPTSRAIVVSTKAYVGHTLGAAGAIEAVFVLDALETGWVPASLGADPLDPELQIAVATEPCTAPLRLALSNSFGFGGSNVSVLFGVRE